MSKSIRISDEVFQALQALVPSSEIFVTSPDAALRRLLGLNNQKTRPTPRRQGSRTPQDSFRQPILRALLALGGSARARDVMDLVGKKMSHQLNKIDRERLTSGVIRWRNTIAFERNAMVELGLLKSNSSRGFWEITPEGKRALRQR